MRKVAAVLVGVVFAGLAMATAFWFGGPGVPAIASDDALRDRLMNLRRDWRQVEPAYTAPSDVTDPCLYTVAWPTPVGFGSATWYDGTWLSEVLLTGDVERAEAAFDIATHPLNCSLLSGVTIEPLDVAVSGAERAAGFRMSWSTVGGEPIGANMVAIQFDDVLIVIDHRAEGSPPDEKATLEVAQRAVSSARTGNSNHVWILVALAGVALSFLVWRGWFVYAAFVVVVGVVSGISPFNSSPVVFWCLVIPVIVVIPAFVQLRAVAIAEVSALPAVPPEAQEASEARFGQLGFEVCIAVDVAGQRGGSVPLAVLRSDDSRTYLDFLFAHRKAPFECFSLLGEGVLTTCRRTTLPATDVLPTQVLPRATDVELVAAHRAAIAFVESRNVAVMEAKCESAEEAYRRNLELTQEAMRASWPRTVWNHIWRSLLRQWTNLGPLQQQPDIEVRLSHLAGTEK